MRRHLNFTVIMCLLALIYQSALQAQTVIPDTAEQRKARAVELSRLPDLDEQPSAMRELAMIHAVIAGLDEPTLVATEKAIEILGKAEKANPGDYELMAAHGSVLTMMARYQKKTSQQLRYTKKGFRKMDRALKKDPDNIGALLQRGNNSLHMPVFLKRSHYAKKDFQRILELVDDQKGAGFKAMVLFQLGQANKQMKEDRAAEQQWRMAAGLSAGYWSDRARSELN